MKVGDKVSSYEARKNEDDLYPWPDHIIEMKESSGIIIEVGETTDSGSPLVNILWSDGLCEWRASDTLDIVKSRE